MKKFPFKKLKIDTIFYEFTQEIENVQDAEFELVIKFKTFKFKKEKIDLELQYTCFSDNDFEKNIYTNGVNFEKTIELESCSIYVQSVHNPIDLKWFKITKSENKTIIDFKLFFDFEYEKTDFNNKNISFIHKIKNKI